MLRPVAARTTLVHAVATLLLTGCGTYGGSSAPIVDRKGVDPMQYQRDYNECQAYAAEVDARRNIGGGALSGAVIGGAMGAIVGNHETAERMAGVGAVTGTARGAGQTAQEKRMVLRNCLIGRGYRVLN